MSQAIEGQSFSLRWTVECREGISIVDVSGELDVAAERDFEAVLLPLVMNEQVTVADLENLEFMDSIGLRLLGRMHQAAEQADTRFLIGRPSPAVRRVLRVSGLIDFFNYVEGAPPLDLV